jgi:uncharacterized membrane protein
MSEQEMQLMVATFYNEKAAKEALAQVKALKKEHKTAVQGGVALRMDASGKIHHEDIGLTPAKGATGGIALGLVVGWMTGGVGLVLGGLGGVIGGILGRSKEEKHMPTEFYNWVAGKLSPGNSALVAVLASPEAKGLVENLQGPDVEIHTAVLTSDLLAQIEEHEDTAYQALTEALNNS